MLNPTNSATGKHIFEGGNPNPILEFEIDVKFTEDPKLAREVALIGMRAITSFLCTGKGGVTRGAKISSLVPDESRFCPGCREWYIPLAPRTHDHYDSARRGMCHHENEIKTEVNSKPSAGILVKP